MAPTMPTITIRNADRLQHVAVTRLQLYVAGRVHALLYPFQAWLAKEVSDTADADGIADAGKLAGVMQAADPRWRAVMRDYVTLLTKARQQGGSIAFGPYRLRHNRYITEPVERLQEAFTPSLDDWGKLAEMWLRRRNYALQVAQQHVYSDGLNLSQRIWRLEQGGMQSIRNTIATGMAQRTSAVELAQQLEGQLNSGEDWPRWTRARLSKMDARERAQDSKGLLRSASDVPVGGSAGISYNALRLARNEIQIANHAVTSDIAIHSPWVTGRKVVLSPAHPASDICDSYAADGPYEKTANFLPLHPQCVTPGQLVQTLNGPVPIERVWRGDYVLTHRGRYCLVTAAWGVSHSDQVYEFVTEEGRFEVTGNHPVLLDRGWVNAEDVQLGDHVLYAVGGGRESPDSVIGRRSSLDAIARSAQRLNIINVVTSALGKWNDVICGKFAFSSTTQAPIVVPVAQFLELFRRVCSANVSLTCTPLVFPGGILVGVQFGPRSAFFQHSFSVSPVIVFGESGIPFLATNLNFLNTQRIRSIPFLRPLVKDFGFFAMIGTSALNAVAIPAARARAIFMKTVQGFSDSTFGASFQCLHTQHYTTVRAIQRRHYTGNVYNMTVEGDNSYTVGGHVVHNCLCRWEEVLMPPGDFAKQVRGWVAGENDFLDDYSSWLGQRSFSPIPEPLGIAAAQELFEAMQMWLDGNVDAMATAIKV